MTSSELKIVLTIAKIRELRAMPLHEFEAELKRLEEEARRREAMSSWMKKKASKMQKMKAKG